MCFAVLPKTSARNYSNPACKGKRHFTNPGALALVSAPEAPLSQSFVVPALAAVFRVPSSVSISSHLSAEASSPPTHDSSRCCPRRPSHEAATRSHPCHPSHALATGDAPSGIERQ